MRENRGASVSVRSFRRLLNFKYKRPGRIGGILSGVNEYNYKQVGPGRLARSVVG